MQKNSCLCPIQRPAGEESGRSRGREETEGQRRMGEGCLGGAHVPAEDTHGLGRWEEVAGLRTCHPVPQRRKQAQEVP